MNSEYSVVFIDKLVNKDSKNIKRKWKLWFASLMMLEIRKHSRFLAASQ